MDILYLYHMQQSRIKVQLGSSGHTTASPAQDLLEARTYLARMMLVPAKGRDCQIRREVLESVKDGHARTRRVKRLTNNIRPLSAHGC